MRYFLQKLSQFLIVFFLVTFGVLVLMRLGLNAPGDPARTLLGVNVTPAQITAATDEFHLDQPYLTQYYYFVKGLVGGDMGFSTRNSIEVSTYIKSRMMMTPPVRSARTWLSRHVSRRASEKRFVRSHSHAHSK